jgi:hypothetical protein
MTTRKVSAPRPRISEAMALSSGIYSLIGVVAGSTATGGLQFGLALRAERRDLRPARRQVKAELVKIAMALCTVVPDDNGRPFVSSDEFASLQMREMWGQYRETLARNKRTAWGRIDEAYELSRRLTIYVNDERAVLAAMDAVVVAIEGLCESRYLVLQEDEPAVTYLNFWRKAFRESRLVGEPGHFRFDVYPTLVPETRVRWRRMHWPRRRSC